MSVVRDESAAEFTDSEPFEGLEVASVSTDTLRASVRVAGVLTGSTIGVLTSILRTHASAGRRYLRVDLGAVHIADPDAVEALVAAHRRIAGLGGMLVLENAGPQVIDAVRAETLFVRPGE